MMQSQFWSIYIKLARSHLGANLGDKERFIHMIIQGEKKVNINSSNGNPVVCMNPTISVQIQARWISVKNADLQLYLAFQTSIL